jgi:hypothetical protein
VGVISILHAFNAPLEFNSHVHTMVTAGGLQASCCREPSVYYDDSVLMMAWEESGKREPSQPRGGLLSPSLCHPSAALGLTFPEQRTHPQRRFAGTLNRKSMKTRCAFGALQSPATKPFNGLRVFA